MLTDNGPEFSDLEAIERSALGAGPRCRVYYCDARQSQQKGGLRAQPRRAQEAPAQRAGVSFDTLDGRDCAELMSQLNSEPRRSLYGAPPSQLLRAAVPETAALLDAERAGRGLPPLLG